MSVLMVELITDGFDPVNKACYKLKEANIPYAVGDEDRYTGHTRLFTLLVPQPREIEARRALGLIAEDPKGGRR